MFTISELKSLQGFPESYTFNGQHAYELLGDAVPPPLAFSVASHIARLLNRAGL